MVVKISPYCLTHWPVDVKNNEFLEHRNGLSTEYINLQFQRECRAKHIRILWAMNLLFAFQKFGVNTFYIKTGWPVLCVFLYFTASLIPKRTFVVELLSLLFRVCVCVFITVTNFNSQPFPLVWIIGIYTYQRWFFAAGDPECLESWEYPSYRMWLGNPTRLELPLASRFSSLQLLER